MAERRFGKAETLDRNQHRAPCASRPIGRVTAFRPQASGFESPEAHQSRARSPTAETAASNPAKCAFESRRAYHAAIAQLAEADGLNPFQCRIVACLRHHARLAQRQSVPFTPGRSGFQNPQRVPIHASLVQRQNACPTRKRSGVQFTDDAPMVANGEATGAPDKRAVAGAVPAATTNTGNER